MATNDNGSSRPHYADVVQELDLLSILVAFQPVVIGTPPLGIDIATSDIDVACTCEDLNEFSLLATRAFATQAQFRLIASQVQAQATVRAQFRSQDWPIEIFCQAVPVAEQHGVRHFRVEERVLNLAPRVRVQIIELKQRGLKTEPAFAQVLELEGDPFEAMLQLESESTVSLQKRLHRLRY